MVVHACNVVTQKADSELAMSSRTCWTTKDNNSKTLSKNKIDRQEIDRWMDG